MSEGLYQVNEMFWSIQGEGFLAGKPSVFIRLQGCPVGCTWCDSKLTWYAGGTKMTTDEIRDRMKQMPPSSLVVITGGEPLLWDLDPLITMIEREFISRRTQLETSGALPWKGRFLTDYVVISPKSAAKWEIKPEVLLRADELKYVVDDEFDPDIIYKHVSQFRDRDYANTKEQPRPSPRVSLMPEGSPPRPEMVEKTIRILQEVPSWNFSPRLQYAYPDIGKLEGRNNAIITPEQARTTARGRRNQPLASDAGSGESARS